ncbi:hypothetical protein GCM10008929_14390 [Alkalibacterium psychrotolerans]
MRVFEYINYESKQISKMCQNDIKGIEATKDKLKLFSNGLFVYYSQINTNSI